MNIVLGKKMVKDSILKKNASRSILIHFFENKNESEFAAIIKWFENFEDTGYMIEIIKDKV